MKLIRRAAHGALWFKVLVVLLMLCGISEKWSSIIAASAVAVWVVIQLRDGHREQYIEPPLVQAARLMKDLVYNNATWVNPETPEQGIERLTAPYRATPRHAPHELAVEGVR